MKSTVFQKSSTRAVKSSLTRFISIILISFLGAGVFAGLAAVSPNMKRVGDEYYDRQNVMDIRMLSTYGFTDEDVKAIRNTDGVSEVMASYTVDATGSVGDKDYAFRINGLSKTTDTSAPDYMNQLKMIDGRWPKNDGEAVIIRPSIGLKNIVLGSTISLDKNSNGDIPDTLDRLKYTIVGVAESPYYLSFVQGNTSVGSGMIDYVLYVPQKNFIVDGYTDMYVSVKGAKELNAFENEYFDHTDIAVERLETLAEKRQTLRHDEFQSDLAEAKKEYNDADKEADEKLGDAKLQLDEGVKTLEDAKEKYVDGVTEYHKQKADAEQQLADAEEKLNEGAKELEDAKEKYADGLADYNEQKADVGQQLADAEKKLNEGAKELEDAKEKYADGLAEYNEQKADAQRQLADAKAELEDAAEKIDDGEKELEANRNRLTSGKSELRAARGKLDNGWADYDKKINELEDGKAALAKNKETLDAVQAQYDAGAASAESAMGMTMEEIEAALPSMESQLNESKAQYETISQLAQLKAARDAYEPGTPEYDALNEQYQAALQAAGLTEEQAAELIAQLDVMKAQLDAAQEQYDQLAGLVTMKHTLAQKWTEYNAAASQIEEGEAQLADARQTLDRGEDEYSEKSAELGSAENQLSQAKDELISARRVYDEGREEYDTQKSEADTKLADAKAELDDAASEITDGEKELTEKQQEYKDKKAEADRKLTDAKAELNDAASEIAKGEKELTEKQQEYKDKKAEADRKLTDAKAELNDAASEIAKGEKELTEKQQEYEDKKLETNKDLADAKQKIEDAENKLSGLGKPKWYVLDRHMNEAFVTYEGDTERMRDLATVFPIVFFLVAALVCLTTMTRMVDEDRTLIGTFKALGYSNGKIAGRYLKYAASASLIGSMGGICVGFWLLPTIIWRAYGIVFALPKMTPAFYFGIGALSVFATVFITTLSTGIAAKNSLRESPAELMRPKAPKSGKRVFLEYVKPVWSRLTFTQKVTVRNLGLNKKRLMMSLAGIIGCTALVVTALGAKNAVRAILDEQFRDIFHYDVTIGFDEEKPSADLTSLLSDKTYFDKSTEVLHNSAEASLKDKDKDTYNIYVVSPKEAEEFTDYVTLYDPETKKNLSFTDDSAVITEKLSLNLNVGVGDTIWVKYLDNDERYPVKITGITRNYASNYVYIGKNAYKASFGETPEYNQFFAITAKNRTDDEIKTYLSEASGIGVISFTDDLLGNIRTSIKSVDNIIWILIIAAGVLAFVVLYNLTNINIGERQRELATLKVLGFYDKETYSYIFRETVILSTVGCLVGLLFGVFLYRAVVTTVEPDMLFLARDLTWQGYLGAIILMMFFTWIVNQCTKPRIRNIDMLESLKSVD